jgi:hypothetical protein
MHILRPTEVLYRSPSVGGTLRSISGIALAWYTHVRELINYSIGQDGHIWYPGAVTSGGMLYLTKMDDVEALLSLTDVILYLCYATADQGVRVKQFKKVLFGYCPAGGDVVFPFSKSLVDTGIAGMLSMPFAVYNQGTARVQDNVSTLDRSQVV